MHPISRYPVPSLDELPADIRERILKVHEKSGFIPNVFLLLARRPDEFRAFFAYHDALMDKESPGLSKADREMVVVATCSATSEPISLAPTGLCTGGGPTPPDAYPRCASTTRPGASIRPTPTACGPSTPCSCSISTTARRERSRST